MKPSRVGAEFHHRHLRQFAAHQVALGGVVVAEHQAVEAEIERAGDRRSPCTLSFHEHSKAAKSSRRSTLAGWPKPVAAIAGSFLLHAASTMPRSRSART